MKSESLRELQSILGLLYSIFTSILQAFDSQLSQIICQSPSAFTSIDFCLLTLHLECLLWAPSQILPAPTSLHPPVAILSAPHHPAPTMLLLWTSLAFTSDKSSPCPLHSHWALNF